MKIFYPIFLVCFYISCAGGGAYPGEGMGGLIILIMICLAIKYFIDKARNEKINKHIDEYYENKDSGKKRNSDDNK